MRPGGRGSAAGGAKTQTSSAQMAKPAANAAQPGSSIGAAGVGHSSVAVKEAGGDAGAASDCLAGAGCSTVRPWRANWTAAASAAVSGILATEKG